MGEVNYDLWGFYWIQGVEPFHEICDDPACVKARREYPIWRAQEMKRRLEAKGKRVLSEDNS